MAHISGTTGSTRMSITVPATIDTYDDDDIIYIRRNALDNSIFSDVLEVVLMVHSLPAGAVVEIQVLKPGTDPGTTANWFVADTVTAVGFQTPVTLFASGVRIRVKSGGTGGESEVSAFWYY